MKLPSFQSRYAAALSHFKAGRIADAQTIFTKLAQERPNVPEVTYQLGLIARQMQDHDTALRHLTQALSQRPGEGAILTALAETQAEAGETDAAAASYDSLIKQAPGNIRLRAEKARMLQTAGQFDAAEAEFRKALKRAPLDGELYRIFLATKKLAKGDPLIAAMRKAWASKKVTGTTRAHLGFALAKAMEDSGQPEQIFRYLTPANRLIRDVQPFDRATRDAEVKHLQDRFADAGAPPAPAEGASAFCPIFVAGLPRSGTTLVEQILASHSAVTGAGEMRHGLEQAYSVLGNPAKGPLTGSDWDAAQLNKFATGYEAAVRRTIRFDTHVTDKSIQSHLIFGLLQAALPEARLIVVRRDPRDIGLSIYKNVFGPGTHRYAYDLEDIAAYIQSHDAMLDFWKARMGGALHEIWYEDLVTNPEEEARKLIAAAGLDWEDGCLRFHENRREVKTLSVHQVRQPIYSGSAQGWRKHAEELAPLINALGLEGKD